MGLDAGLIELYRKRQPTISEHQQTIAGYLRLRPFDDAEVTQLEQFLFEEACRLEQTAALTGRAREFLKEQRVLEPAEFRIARIVGGQRAGAREHIFRRVAASVPNGLAGTLEDLLVVKPDETSSGLQAIKANPSKPSVDAMLTLLDKLRVIEATGVLGVDLLWLNGNYQRALFHQVRKSSVTRLRELAEPRRRAALVCFLWQSYRDAVEPPTVIERLADIPEEEIWLAKQKSARTRRAYRLDVRHFMGTLAITGHEELRQVDHRAVIAWEGHMREVERAAPSTVRRRLSALSSLFRHLVRHGHASKNPVTEVERPDINRDEGTTLAFSKQDARKLLDLPDPETLEGLRDRAILSVGLQVGLRRAEIAALTVGDLASESWL